MSYMRTATTDLKYVGSCFDDNTILNYLSHSLSIANKYNLFLFLYVLKSFALHLYLEL